MTRPTLAMFAAAAFDGALWAARRMGRIACLMVGWALYRWLFPGAEGEASTLDAPLTELTASDLIAAGLAYALAATFLVAVVMSPRDSGR